MQLFKIQDSLPGKSNNGSSTSTHNARYFARNQSNFFVKKKKIHNVSVSNWNP